MSTHYASQSFGFKELKKKSIGLMNEVEINYRGFFDSFIESANLYLNIIICDDFIQI